LVEVCVSELAGSPVEGVGGVAGTELLVSCGGIDGLSRLTELLLSSNKTIVSHPLHLIYLNFAGVVGTTHLRPAEPLRPT
jgi:hypothetical protein